MLFGPKEITFQEIGISGLWVIIAWFLWALFMLGITFATSWVISIADTFSNANDWVQKTGSIFPLILSFITFIGTTITMFLTYKILNLTAPERYRKSWVILGQIAMYCVFSYILVTPLYIYLWLQSYNYIMYVFMIHVLLLSFWINVILEIMNNYRHVLLGIYWSIVGLFLASFMAALIFTSFSTWAAKLISLILLLPIINFCITFCTDLFSLMYYKYYAFTNQDPLWDIFTRIENDEKEAMKEEEEKNMLG